MSDDIHQAFQDGAILVITKPDYAYVQLGNMRYYFHGQADKRDVTLFSGEKVTQTLIPYDGWERTAGNDLVLEDSDDDTE